MNKGYQPKKEIKVERIYLPCNCQRKIPKEYKNFIIFRNNKFEVYDETQAYLLGEFDYLWQAILCLESYCKEVLQWEEEFEDKLEYAWERIGLYAKQN